MIYGKTWKKIKADIIIAQFLEVFPKMRTFFKIGMSILKCQRSKKNPCLYKNDSKSIESQGNWIRCFNNW